MRAARVTELAELAKWYAEEVHARFMADEIKLGTTEMLLLSTALSQVVIAASLTVLADNANVADLINVVH